MVVPAEFIYFSIGLGLWLLLGDYLRNSRLEELKEFEESEFNVNVARLVQDGKLGEEDTVQFVFDPYQAWWQVWIEILINPLNLTTTFFYISAITPILPHIEEEEEEFFDDE